MYFLESTGFLIVQPFVHHWKGHPSTSDPKRFKTATFTFWFYVEKKAPSNPGDLVGSGTEGLLGSCMSLGLFCSMLVARHSRCKKNPDVFSRINRIFDCSAFCPPLKRTPIYIRPKTFQNSLSTIEKDTHLHQTQTFQNSYTYLLILCRKEGTFKSRRLGGFRYWRFVGFLYVLGACLFHVSGLPFPMQEKSRCIF